MDKLYYTKPLAQTMTTSNTLTTMFTATLKTQLRTLFVCNQDTVTRQVRFAIVPKWEADNPKHYIYYNLQIRAWDTFLSDLDLGIEIGDQVRVYADTNLLSVNVYGSEFNYNWQTL